ncbi:aldehyde dehydrogenase family protein [Streptomyces sp. M10(2022)]
MLAASADVLAGQDVAQFAGLNREFHSLLCDTEQTQMIHRMLTGIWSKTETAQRGFRLVPWRLPESHAEHVAIRDALVAGELHEAGRLVHAHEIAAMDALIRLWASSRKGAGFRHRTTHRGGGTARANSGEVTSMTNTQALINGVWTDAEDGATFEVTDPADGSPVAAVADCGAERAAAAVDAAEAALPGWRAMPAHERAAVLRRAAALLTERAGEIGSLMTREQGKPLHEAVGETSSAGTICSGRRKRPAGCTARRSRPPPPTAGYGCCRSRSGWSPPSRRGTSRSR